MKTIENPCATCIQPCVDNDGECLGPITEEGQIAKNGAIIYKHDPLAFWQTLAPELVKAVAQGKLEEENGLDSQIPPNTTHAA